MLQASLVAPEAVNQAALPEQIVALFTATFGVVLMLSVWVEVLEPVAFFAIREIV